MKKFYSLAVCLMMGVSAVFAQQGDNLLTVVDKAGNIVADGAVVTVTEYEGDPFGSAPPKMPSGLTLKNESGEIARVALEYTITAIPGGYHQCCFPESCEAPEYSAGTYLSDVGIIKAGEDKYLEVEWFAGAEGVCSVTYTLKYYGYDPASDDFVFSHDGQSFTVNYTYGTSGIGSAVTSGGNVSVSYFDMAGRNVPNPDKGIYMKKMTMADGTVSVSKVIIR